MTSPVAWLSTREGTGPFRVWGTADEHCASEVDPSVSGSHRYRPLGVRASVSSETCRFDDRRRDMNRTVAYEHNGCIWFSLHHSRYLVQSTPARD